MAPGIKPMPPALEAWSLNHWTTREASYGIPFSHSSLQPCFPSTCYCHCHDFHPWGPAYQKDGRSPHSHACPCWPEVNGLKQDTPCEPYQGRGMYGAKANPEIQARPPCGKSTTGGGLKGYLAWAWVQSPCRSLGPQPPCIASSHSPKAQCTWSPLKKPESEREERIVKSARATSKSTDSTGYERVHSECASGHYALDQ